MLSELLELRPLEGSDAAFVASLYGDARVTHTLLRIQRPISTEEAREFCMGSSQGEFRFGGALRADGTLIGVGSVTAHPQRPGIATIGYSVLPAFWGRGLGAELAALLVGFATGSLGAVDVRATTLDENPASVRVLEKLGFDVLEAGAIEVDSRGDERNVTRWALRT